MGKQARDHGALLAAVADALNACDEAGFRVRLKHNAVMADTGYVFRIAGEWAPRTRLHTEFTHPDDEED